MSRHRHRKRISVKNSGYSHYGASRTKPSVSTWYSASKSPAEDITNNLELLRERSRDLYAGGGPLGRGGIDRIVLNSVGAGLTLNCRIGTKTLGLTEQQAAEWEENTEREFAFWAESKNCCRVAHRKAHHPKHEFLRTASPLFQVRATERRRFMNAPNENHKKFSL